MTTATRERIEEIRASAAALENYTSDVRQFLKARLFDRLLPLLTALCEEMEREREDERIELVMHEVFMESLLDDLKAPKHPDNDPSRPKFGPYGRLRAYAESIGVKASMWEPLPQPPAT